VLAYISFQLRFEKILKKLKIFLFAASLETTGFLPARLVLDYFLNKPCQHTGLKKFKKILLRSENLEVQQQLKLN
jgi:hypothetical protein